MDSKTRSSTCKKCSQEAKIYRVNQRLPPPESIHYIEPRSLLNPEYTAALVERADLAGMIESATASTIYPETITLDRLAHYRKLHADAIYRANHTPIRATSDRILQQAQRYQTRIDSAERSLARLRRANADARSDRAMVPLQTRRLAELDAYLQATPCPHVAAALPTKDRRTHDQLRHACKQIAQTLLTTYEYLPQQGAILNHTTGAILSPRYVNSTTISKIKLPWRWIIGTLISPDFPRPVVSRCPDSPNCWVRGNLTFT